MKVTYRLSGRQRKELLARQRAELFATEQNAERRAYPAERARIENRRRIAELGGPVVVEEGEEPEEAPAPAPPPTPRSVRRGRQSTSGATNGAGRVDDVSADEQKETNRLTAETNRLLKQQIAATRSVAGAHRDALRSMSRPAI